LLLVIGVLLLRRRGTLAVVAGETSR